MRAALDVAGLELHGISKLTIVKHSVTRFRITLHVFEAKLAAETDRSQKSYRTQWARMVY